MTTQHAGATRGRLKPGEPSETFYLVGIPNGQSTNGMDRYVRKGASPDEHDPWVRVPGQAARSPEVHRFTSEAEARAWIEERRKQRGTKCRAVMMRGPVLG